MSEATTAASVRTRSWGRSIRWIAGGLAAAVVAGALVVTGVAPQATAAGFAPEVGASVAGTYLAGEDVVVDLSFTSAYARDSAQAEAAQFNLSAGIVLPENVTVTSTGTLGTPVVYPTSPANRLVPGVYKDFPGDCTALGLEDAPGADSACQVPIGKQYLVFQNISDLPAGAQTAHTLTLRPRADSFPVGSTDLNLTVTAITSSNERYLPVFPGSTGVAAGNTHTSAAGHAPLNIPVSALRIEKSEPSPESELLRGVHENTTTYTLQVFHTGEGDISNATVVDYLPAGLEYLGLGGTDATTNANGNRGGGLGNSFEYPGAASLTATPAPSPAAGAWQTAGERVETVLASIDANGQVTEGAGSVFTKVTWNLGTLLATADARDTRLGVEQIYAGTAGTPGLIEIRYRAAVPLFENTLEFGYSANATGQQIANLDNNRGASTRHGVTEDDLGAAPASSFENLAIATGQYAGATTSDTATETIDAVDLRLLKSVDSSAFTQGDIARYTLQLASSEYTSAVIPGPADRPYRLVDDMADGLCPVFPAGTPVLHDPANPHSSSANPVPNLSLGNPDLGPAAVTQYVSVDDWNAALTAAGVDPNCDWGPATSTADPAADALQGAQLIGIGYDGSSGHFHLDFALSPADVLQAGASHEIVYSVRQNETYRTDGGEQGATTSGDTLNNEAEVYGLTTSIAALNGVVAVGGAIADGVWNAWDDSAASIQAELSSIEKTVLERSAGVPSAAEIWQTPANGGPAAADWVKTVTSPFTVGDQAWYRILLDPPSGADVRNPKLTDYLPAGVSFDPVDANTDGRFDNIVVKPASLRGLGDCQPATEAEWLAEFAPNPTVNGDAITWNLGSKNCIDGNAADRFLPLDTTLEFYLKVTVTDLSAFGQVDLPENLAKYQQENVEGEIFFLRDAAAIELDQSVELVKGIRDINGAPAPGNAFLSDVDHLQVKQGDAVTFRVDVQGAQLATTGYQLWDALPAGIEKADLAGIQADGTFTSATAASVTGAPAVQTPLAAGSWTARVFDFGDTGYPTEVRTSITDAERSVIVWNVTAAVPGSIPATDSTPEIPQGLTLGYTVLVPSDTSTGGPAALIDQQYDNTASIVAYAAVNNGGGSTTLIPTGDARLSTRDADTAAGEIAVTDAGTVDDSDVYLPTATMTKTLVATEIAPSGTTVTDANNPANAIVQGEYATFDYSVVVPANTTVREGVLADVGTLVRQSGGTMSPGTARYQLQSATLQASPAGIAVDTVTGADPAADPTKFAFRSDTGKLVFPRLYTTDATADTFTVRIVVWMQDLDATHTGPASADRPSIANTALLRNTARFAFTDAAGDAATPLQATADVQYREPNLGITKTASPDTAVQAGQTVTYTLSITNTGRVKSYDNTVVDTVPAGLLIDTASLAAAGATFVPNETALQTGLGGTITWSHAQFAALREIPATATLSYTARIDPTTGAGTSYVNTARVTGYTLPSTLTDAAARRGDRTATSSETITATTAAIDKGVRVSGSTAAYAPSASAPIGETVQYRVPITLNPNINYYDVRVRDVLPAGVTMVAGTMQVQMTTGAGSPVDVTADWTHSSSGQTHTWVHGPTGGDLLANSASRTLIFSYDVLLASTVAANATTLTNTASFAWARTNGGALGTPLTDTAAVTVLNPALQITKLVDGVDAITRNPDSTFDYTLSVSQAAIGNTPAHNITVQDVVPAGVKVDIASITPAPSSTTAGVATGTGGTITWQLAGPLHQQAGAGTPKSIALSYSASFVDSVALSDAALTNTANVTHFESFGTGGRSYDPPLSGAGSIRDTAQVAPLFPNVVPTKTVTTPVDGQTYGLAYVGEAFNWTLTLQNRGAGIAENLTMTDVLPANWVYVGTPKISMGGSPVDFVDPSIATDGAVQTLSWSAQQLRTAGATPLAADGAVVITFDARPLAAATTTPGVGIATNPHINALRVTATDAQDADRNADGDYVGDDSTATAHLGSADLRLVKEAIGGDADGKWIAGQPVGGAYAQPQWRITVTNHGPDASFGPFVLEDTTTLPTGVTTGVFTARYFASAADTTGVALNLSGAGTVADPFEVGERSTSLRADGSDRIVLRANVSIAAAAEVTIDAENAASVLGRTYEAPEKIPAVAGNDNPNSDEVVQPLTAFADLAIEKVVTNVETPNVGGTISWQLQPRNLGPSVSVSTPANPITITDTVPASISGVADPSTPVWDASLNGAAWAAGALAQAGDEITLTFIGDSLPVGAAATIALTGTIATSHTGALTNAAEIEAGETTDPVDPNNRDEATITPDDSTEVRIAKTRVVPDGAGGWAASTTPIVPGDPVHYRITVINDGPADARRVTVVDEVPVGLTYASHASLAGTWSFAGGGTTSTGTDPSWNTFTLSGTQPAGSADATAFVVTYDTDPALITGASVVENWAEVTAENDRDFDPAEQRDDDNSDATRIVDLGIVKSHAGTAPFDAGTAVTYSLVVTNHGPSVTEGPIVISDQLPAGMSYDSGTATYQVNGAAPVSLEPVLSGTGDRTLAWSLLAASDEIAVGSTITVVFDARIGEAVQPQTLANAADVSGPDEDDNPDNDRDTDEVTTATLAEMVIDKQVEAGPWVAGTNVEYTLTVRNDGPSAANATVIDTLPAGLTVVSASGTGDWDCSATVTDSQTATCEYPLHPVGAAATSTITVVAALAASTPKGTVLENVAELTWTDRRGAHEDSDPAEITVTANADLGIVKTAVDADGVEVTEVTSGTIGNYRFEVANFGPSDAVGPVTITDTLPLGVTFADLEGSDWAATPGAVVPGVPQQVIFTHVGGLAAGLDAPDLVISVFIDPAVADGAALMNTATVGSQTTEPDPDPHSNTDDATVTAVRAVDLAIVKSHVAGDVRIGDELPFTLQVTNNGPSQATGISVTDTVPAGLEVVSAPGDTVGTGWTLVSVTPVDPADPAAGATLVASYADALAPTEDAEPLVLVTRVTAAAYETVTNTGEVAGTEPDTDASNNRSEDPVTVPPMVTLVVEKTAVGRFKVGETGEYRISVKNSGPTADPGPITVTDELPAGLSYAASPGLPTGVAVAVNGRTVTWTIADGLAVDASIVLALEVHVAQAAAPSVTNVVTVDSAAEKTPDSVLSDDATVEVQAADPLVVTGGELTAGALFGIALLLLLGGVVMARAQRRRGAHSA